MIIKPKPTQTYPNRNFSSTLCTLPATCDTISKDIRIACPVAYLTRAQKGQ
jgi:hypothetical protein